MKKLPLDLHVRVQSLNGLLDIRVLNQQVVILQTCHRNKKIEDKVEEQDQYSIVSDYSFDVFIISFQNNQRRILLQRK